MDSSAVVAQQASSNLLDVLKVVFGGIISIASVYVAILVYLIRKREPWGRSLFEIFKLMETKEMRHIRRQVVYACAPDQPGVWTAPGLNARNTHDAIDRWGAYMDMLSLLYFSRQLNRVLFFEMYGDVIIRSAYKLAHYANEQRLLRGEQFWLPYQLLTRDILRVWKRRVKRGSYPPSIGFAERPDELTVESMQANTELRRFLSANRRKLL